VDENLNDLERIKLYLSPTAHGVHLWISSKLKKETLQTTNLQIDPSDFSSQEVAKRRLFIHLAVSDKLCH
jgi:hypothetical protein